MFSAFKRLTSKSEAQSQNIPHEMKMSQNLQKKFCKGVQYNMKIIIKGDRNVGKSCLLERLQGKGFIETYTPTEEIQVASIQWSFKATEDIVKVEVWDVVDRGKSKKRTMGLKLSTGIPTEIPALDAEFLDVYKGTHGVILMMDVTKAWTFEYVSRELTKIPTDLPVLILGNHCDMSHHRVITAGQVMGLIESLTRNSEIMYGESSMRNGFGLRLLHKFLGLPFLRLQKVTLLALLERNKTDTEVCGFEVAEFLKSDDSDYNKFLDNLSNKRRQIADSNSNNILTTSSIIVPNSASNSSINSNNSSANSITTSEQEFKPKKSIIVGGGQPIIVNGQLNISSDPKFRLKSEHTSKSVSVATNFVSSLLTKDKVQEAFCLPEIKHQSFESRIISVEEFCPDGGLDKGFLEDLPSSPGSRINKNSYDDSESDNDNCNPLVASFIEDPGGLIDDTNYNDKKHDVKLKVNPLAKGRKNSTEKISDFKSESESPRRYSISSNEMEITKQKETINTGTFDDNLSSWLTDTNLRRSPEGGEDTTASNNIQEPNLKNNSNDEKVEKKKKKKKEKKSSKDKDEKTKEKKSKRKSKENDLEDFLNGTNGKVKGDEEEYESI